MKYLTLDWLKKHGACEGALRVFELRFGTEATIKEVIDYLRVIEEPTWEGWLLCQTVPLTIAMIEVGADIHVANDYALCWAVAKGRLNVVKYLVKAGVNIHTANDYALCLAAFNGHLSVVKYLVEKGADIHARNDHALYLARSSHHPRIVKFLGKAALVV
jgi:hypothetical protein